MQRLTPPAAHSPIPATNRKIRLLWIGCGLETGYSPPANKRIQRSSSRASGISGSPGRARTSGRCGGNIFTPSRRSSSAPLPTPYPRRPPLRIPYGTAGHQRLAPAPELANGADKPGRTRPATDRLPCAGRQQPGASRSGKRRSLGLRGGGGQTALCMSSTRASRSPRPGVLVEGAGTCQSRPPCALERAVAVDNGPAAPGDWKAQWIGTVRYLPIRHPLRTISSRKTPPDPWLRKTFDLATAPGAPVLRGFARLPRAICQRHTRGRLRLVSRPWRT